MKKLMFLFFFIAGCTEQTMVKNWGGSMNVELDPGQKLVMVTWKQNDLWLLTRVADEGETMEVYNFKEMSNFGIWEGTITIVEQNFKSDKNGGD